MRAKTGLVCVIVLLAATLAPGQGFDNIDSTVLVIPSRYTIVQLGFDVLRLRPAVSLVAYDISPTGEPVLHVWNAQQRDWVRTGIEELRSGSIFRSPPRSAVVMGTDEEIDPALSEAVKAVSPTVEEIHSRALADLVNGLNKVLRFTPGEWKRLARKHGLVLKDLNEQRRRYGKYGPPKR